ncbi:MAG: 50S ribosomal protein L11 methyltransferase [Pyrinomonadaceae bacterium]
MTDKKERWFVLEINAKSEAAEAMEFALNELDALGTEINNLGRDRPVSVMIKGYFNEKPDEGVVHDQIGSSLRIHQLPEGSVDSWCWNEIQNQDWLAEWKKHWKPSEVGRFIIAPPWSEITETGKIVIRIEPNMAFGTGTHETTQLCLKAIGEIYQSGQSFLDVGTGTGILAIAVANLGGTDIDACDTDADSVRIAIENAAANGVGDMVGFLDGAIDEGTAVHDFVCANVTIDVIVPILPLLISKTRSVLLLSGILAEQEGSISDELGKLGVTDFQIEQAGEWISVLIRR